MKRKQRTTCLRWGVAAIALALACMIRRACPGAPGNEVKQPLKVIWLDPHPSPANLRMPRPSSRQATSSRWRRARSDRLGTLLTLRSLFAENGKNRTATFSTPGVPDGHRGARNGPTGTLYSYEGFQSGIRRNNGQWRAAFHR